MSDPTLAQVLTMTQKAADEARERVPVRASGEWSATDEMRAAEWLALDRVNRMAREIAEEGTRILEHDEGPKAEALRRGEHYWGRVWINGRWRPGYHSNAGTFVAPMVGGAWRAMTAEDERTFQPRIATHQHTTGRIWDDAYYETEDGQ